MGLVHLQAVEQSGEAWIGPNLTLKGDSDVSLLLELGQSGMLNLVLMWCCFNCRRTMQERAAFEKRLIVVDATLNLAHEMRVQVLQSLELTPVSWTASSSNFRLLVTSIALAVHELHHRLRFLTAHFEFIME